MKRQQRGARRVEKLRLVRSHRRDTAELIAHLGEVEARRLHLEAACSSMFEYCVRRLGLSEDEACRRIDVARLGRRFPALFPRLASGDISLTVAAALKPYLADDNQSEVIGAVAGKSVHQAREALAALFPRPDVESSVRKLPERRITPAASAEPVPSMAYGGIPDPHATPALPGVNEAGTMGARAAFTPPGVGAAESDGAGLNATVSVAPPLCAGMGGSPSAATVTPARLQLSAPARIARPPIEALSEARYRVQFTASTSLKEKLDRARDLMRHRNPSGDLGPIVERAVDLLLEQLMKDRFGVARQPRPPKKNAERVSNATRRSVVERDGLQCNWVDSHGQRCEARAWLELDHRRPRAKGGGSGPENIRLLCRAHNRLAAEREFGRAHIETAIAAWRDASARAGEPAACEL